MSITRGIYIYIKVAWAYHIYKISYSFIPYCKKGKHKQGK